MKKSLIILFFASILLYAKAEAYTFFVYSEDRTAIEYVEAVERAFMNSGHRIASSENSYLDYYAIVEVNSKKENLSLWILEWEDVEIELKVTIMDPQQQYMIARESIKAIGDSADKLAEKVVKKIDKALKSRR